MTARRGSERQPRDDLRETDQAARRFREIAAPTLEQLIATDGEPHPDAQLLDFAGEALAWLIEAERLEAQRRAIYEACTRYSLESRERAKCEQLWELREEKVQAAKTLMRRVRKIRATTGAGIYAKALLVRHSKTGAPELAASLAEDLIAVPALRASLWPTD